ncbi:hypothetical protein AB0E54_25165 [Amycolatopsis coloradensis]|uniref:hypothetical protein n=1 Tax=Amycolatopsis coloradensis TaxID=76021 RepID=UPI003407ABA4
MLRTTTWVRLNWGDFKELTEKQKHLVVISNRGRLVAAAMPPDQWKAMATARGIDLARLIRKGDSAVKQGLAEALRDAARGMATVSENVYGKYDTLVIAPVSILDDTVREDYARQAKRAYAEARGPTVTAG